MMNLKCIEVKKRSKVIGIDFLVNNILKLGRELLR